MVAESCYGNIKSAGASREVSVQTKFSFPTRKNKDCHCTELAPSDPSATIENRQSAEKR